MSSGHDTSTDQLASSLDIVGTLLADLQLAQLDLPTPCDQWSVRQVAYHLVGMNRVFAALLKGDPMPERVPIADADLVAAYTDSSRQLVACFREPGTLDRELGGPLGSSSGRDRLWIRMYDLVGHGWDIARATDQHLDLPDDVVERVLVFAEGQVDTMPRDGRFQAPQPVSPATSPIDRLAAFLGRDPLWSPERGEGGHTLHT